MNGTVVAVSVRGALLLGDEDICGGLTGLGWKQAKGGCALKQAELARCLQSSGIGTSLSAQRCWQCLRLRAG